MEDQNKFATLVYSTLIMAKLGIMGMADPIGGAIIGAISTLFWALDQNSNRYLNSILGLTLMYDSYPYISIYILVIISLGGILLLISKKD